MKRFMSYGPTLVRICKTCKSGSIELGGTPTLVPPHKQRRSCWSCALVGFGWRRRGREYAHGSLEVAALFEKSITGKLAEPSGRHGVLFDGCAPLCGFLGFLRLSCFRSPAVQRPGLACVEDGDEPAFSRLVGKTCGGWRLWRSL